MTRFHTGYAPVRQTLLGCGERCVQSICLCFRPSSSAIMGRQRRASVRPLHSRGSLLGWEAAISRLTAKPTGEHHHIATTRAWPSYIAAQDMIRYTLYLRNPRKLNHSYTSAGSPFPIALMQVLLGSERSSRRHCDGHYPVNRVLHHVLLKPSGKRLSGELHHIQPTAAAQRCSSARSDSSIIRSSS